MKKLNRAEEFASYLQENQYVLVQFGTESCAPCKSIECKLNQWNRTCLLYVSVDKFIELCGQNQVYTAPTLRFYRYSKCMLEVSGYFSLDAFLMQIERILALDSNS